MGFNEARQEPSPEAIKGLLGTLFKRRRFAQIQHLPDGLCNFNYKVDFTAGEPIVLRIYGRDPAACQKEIDLLRLIRDRIPVPEILDAFTNGNGEVGPFIILRHVDGISFRQLKGSGDAEAIAQAAASIGETLAKFSHYQFSDQGRLGAGLTITGPFLNGAKLIPEFIDSCLASSTLCSRIDKEVGERLYRLVWSRSDELACLQSERSLVHCDFSNRNLLVCRKQEKWEVAAVIDWEFAATGSPLFDIASFLRYEKWENPLREPYFSAGYQRGGGKLPDDWRRLARIVDLTSLCRILTESDVPTPVVTEVANLVRATATAG